MYLKTVRELADGDAAPVPISALAERLGVSNVSATEMVHRLQDQGLLQHTPYKGVALTAEGQRWAALLIRSHHLWERFLIDHLHLPWEHAHDYACRLEHATDTAVTEALAAYLDHPQTCPHGNPIPDAAGNVAPPADVPLTALAVGQAGTVSRIYPESTMLLEYVARHNLKPGYAIGVTEIAPFNGPIMVRCADETHPLGREVAGRVFIRINEDGK